MADKVTFSAARRDVMGKKSNTLRKQSLVPANINGDVEKPVAISVEKVGFQKLFAKAGETGLVYLTVEGETKDRPVLISEVQMDPISGEIMHVVFRQVDLTEKVGAEVPVELIGELQVKNALIVTVHDEIKVSALPADLPEKFEIDISLFTEFGQSVTFNQLNYDKTKVTLEIEPEEFDTPVVLVQEHKEQVEEEAPAPAEGAAEGADAAAPAAEGEAAPAAEEKKE